MLKAKVDNVTLYGKLVDLKNASQSTLKTVKRLCPNLIGEVKKKQPKVVTEDKSEEV